METPLYPEKERVKDTGSSGFSVYFQYWNFRNFNPPYICNPFIAWKQKHKIVF